jgi:hypothetical protein
MTSVNLEQLEHSHNLVNQVPSFENWLCFHQLMRCYPTCSVTEATEDLLQFLASGADRWEEQHLGCLPLKRFMGEVLTSPLLLRA